MLIDIFDVGHGACAVVTGTNGKRLMIDCGDHTDLCSYWSPANQFFGQHFEVQIIANLDADHVRAYKETLRNIRIGSVVINNTINAYRLRLMKSDGMSEGIGAIYESLQMSNGVINMPFDVSPIKVSIFRHPFGVFTDTNNLSLVTFVEYAGFCMMFTGDIEEDGWEAAMSCPNPDFLAALARVNVATASHHGRKNGCCSKLFQYCQPQVFIVSDKEKMHDTQETDDWYRQHASGVFVGRLPFAEKRYFMTTRKDGCITISVDAAKSVFSVVPKSPRQEFGLPKLGLQLPDLPKLPRLSDRVASAGALYPPSVGTVPESLFDPFPGIFRPR